jgi:DNA-binding transcriptional ArsR family regulator
MARRRDTITLTDPRALRALAHPARQRLVEELFSGRVLTATQAAALVDLTPSAVSHHLRALEKWGLAKRAAGSGDGRERPWAGTARSLTIESSEGAGSAAAISSILAMEMRAAERDLERFRGDGPDPWENAYRGLSRGRLWLTEEETRELSETLEAKIAEYTKGRSAARHPRDARRASFTWSLVPVEPPPGDEA